MARTVGSEGGRTQAAIADAAAALFARHGFEAVTMRQIAEAVGVQAAALYRYFPTKEELLIRLMVVHMEALHAAWADEKAKAGHGSADSGANLAGPAVGADAGGPVALLAAFVDNHVRFHLANRHSTHVSNMELRSLSAANLASVLALRTAYEGELRQILRAGSERDAFRVGDLALTTMAIIQMITGVIVWFRPDERLSVDEIVATYHTLTMRLVGIETDARETGDVRARHEVRAG